jgi:hypothetical protein
MIARFMRCHRIPTFAEHHLESVPGQERPTRDLEIEAEPQHLAIELNRDREILHGEDRADSG